MDWVQLQQRLHIVLEWVCYLSDHSQPSVKLSVRMESVCYLIPAYVTVDGLDHAVKMVCQDISLAHA